MCWAEAPRGLDLFVSEVAKSLQELLVVMLNLFKLQTAKQCSKVVPKKETVAEVGNGFPEKQSRWISMKNIHTEC